MGTPFKKGDILRLVSGGPKMVVDSLHSGRVWVCWFDSVGGYHSTWFDDDTRILEYALPLPVDPHLGRL